MYLLAHNLNGGTILFDPEIGSYQMIPLWIRVEMAMKGYTTFPKAPGLKPI